MVHNYENCSVCGERKHLLNACPRCGFQRNPKDNGMSGSHMKQAMLKATKANSDWTVTSQGQTTKRSHKTKTKRVMKPELTQPKEISSKAPSQQARSKSSRWATVETGSTLRINPTRNDFQNRTSKKQSGTGRTLSLRKTTRTQVESNDKGDERDIIIGLDFGTACTKVIIRDDVIQKTYAVPFGELAYDGFPYLIATRVYAESDGSLSLEGGEFNIDDLKIKLLGDADQLVLTNNQLDQKASALDICTGYLALVLREVVEWFLETHADMYRNTCLIWQLNIGIPSRSYDDQHQCETFRLLALAAWRAMVTQGPVNVVSTQKAIEDSRQDIQIPKNHNNGEIHPEDVGAVPEVIAEVVGYARSNLRREGTHLLVDVGAGTLDVATFVLYSKNGDDQYGLLTTEVEKLGAYSLHRQRVVDVASYVEQQLNNILSVNDGISPLPDLESYQPIDSEGLRKIDDKFNKQCVKLLCGIIHTTKTRRNPAPYVWKNSLPVLLCGGGHRIQLYQNAIESAREHTIPNTGFDYLDLNKPDNLDADDLAPGGFYRLAVAYGLSTRRDQIGIVVPPKAIEDILRVEASEDYRDNFIGPEMT